LSSTFKIRTGVLPVVLILLLILFNAVFSSLPLVGKIGYEHSAANTFLIFILTGILSVSYFRNKYENGKSPLLFFVEYKFTSLIIIFIPFLFALISTLFFSKCPVTDGMLFYVVLTLPAIILGSAAGYSAYFFSRKYAYVVFVFITLILILLSLIEFYFNPQIYFYNSIIGFLPGTIYDEDLKVDLALIIYRLTNLSFAAFVFLVFPKYEKETLKKYLVVLSIILLIGVFYFIKPKMSFSSDVQRIERHLTNYIQTEHFKIDYSLPRKSNEELSHIGLLHEYYYEQIKNEFGLKDDQKILSFLFKDAEQKRELFGAGNADVAKPWLNQIYLNYDGYNKSLKHELVHVLAGHFGATIFKISDAFNSAFVEGIAMAIENNFDGYPVHYAAKLAFDSGYKVDIKKLFSGLNFFGQYPSISYIYAGSFIRFLIGKYGIDKIKKLYGDYDVEKYFNKDIGQLQKEYFSFLGGMKIISNKNTAQLYFGGQPIFKKYCPRSAAKQINEGWILFDRKKYQKALEIFSAVYLYSDSYPALSGEINSLIKLNKISTAENILEKEIPKFKTSKYFYTLEILLSEIKFRNNNIPDAVALLDSVAAQNPHIIYSNNIKLKKEFLARGIELLKKYFDAETNVKLNMLVQLNKDSIRYFSIPSLLSLVSDSVQIKKICADFLDRVNVNDFESSYAALKLSEYSESVGDYKLAKEYAVKALYFKGNEFFTHTLSENLRRVNWLNNFADEIKPFFVYQ